MARIRLVFLCVAVALAVAGALLVHRAFRAVELERSVRHRAVAERAFDELERALSGFLRGEEARPVEQYRFLVPVADAVGGAPSWVRSPLSRDPDADWPFVLGHFALDAAGRFTTPLLPGDADRERETGFVPAPDRLARVRSLEDDARAVLATRSTQRDWARREAKEEDGAGARGAEERGAAVQPPLEEGAAAAGVAGRAAPRGVTQAPGTTVAVTGGDSDRASEVSEQRADGPRSERLPAPAGSSYDALRAFNVGAEERQKRGRKVVESPRELAFEDAAPEPVAPGGTAALRDFAWEPSTDLEVADRVAASPPPASDEAEAERASDEAEAERPAAPSAKAARPPIRPVEVYPFVARSTPDGDRIVLTRLVVTGGAAHHQGIVLDRAALERWLREEVPALGRLPGAALGFGSQDAAWDGAAFVYRHRFAEPFDALDATLALEPLGGGGGARSVALLSAALALVGGVGLLALYRMVAVTVAFAARRSNFVAAVSHELKTPLTAIRMYAEMLRDGMVDTEARRAEYYATLTAESERLSRLIQNVLDFAGLEKGTRTLQLHAGSLAPVLEEAASVLRPHAERLGFRLRVDAQDDLPPVRFDRDALLQVVFNLVDNALKYAGRASDRAVVVELRREGAGVRLAVRDGGPGVPERRLERIFEPFYRGEDELTRTTQGAGIGLALVRGLVQQMGARISGRNVPGGGFEVAVVFAPA